MICRGRECPRNGQACGPRAAFGNSMPRRRTQVGHNLCGQRGCLLLLIVHFNAIVSEYLRGDWQFHLSTAICDGMRRRSEANCFRRERLTKSGQSHNDGPSTRISFPTLGCCFKGIGPQAEPPLPVCNSGLRWNLMEHERLNILLPVSNNRLREELEIRAALPALCGGVDAVSPVTPPVKHFYYVCGSPYFQCREESSK